MSYIKILNTILLFIVLIPVVEASTLRVNNTPYIMTGYTNVQDAVNAANPGDTIHIEGSPVAYTVAGNHLAISKKLILIGPGYYLANNPDTQHNKKSALLNFTISFNAGSEGTMLAGIEIYSGLYNFEVIPIATSYTGNRLIINTSDISVHHCRLRYLQLKNDIPLNNISIQKSVFNPGVIAVAGGTSTVGNIKIANCLFRNDGSDWTVISQNGLSTANWEISNNTFFWKCRLVILNTTLANNLFYFSNSTQTVSNNPSNTYSNNVMNYAVGGMTSGDAGNNSIRTEAIDKWFLRKGGDYLDFNWISAASDATCPLRDTTDPENDLLQKGMFGGIDPYILSGIFKMPSVYDIQTYFEVDDHFKITIKTKVN